MIRLKNLDLNTDGLKGTVQTALGDITATLERGVFVSPVTCVVDFIDIYSGQALTGQSSCQVMAIRAQVAASSGSSLQVRSTSQATTTTATNDINANSRYRLTPSANNSLTVGTAIELNFSQQGTGVLSAVTCVVTYTPLKHRETR